MSSVPYRVVIAGGPRCGKTTLSHELASSRQVPTVRHTDDLVGIMPWSEQSAEVARWLCLGGSWIVEGVAVGRALRKWLENAEPNAKPCDVALYLDSPHERLTPAQEAMRKGCLTVWQQVLPELVTRRVVIAGSLAELGGGP